MSDIKTVIGNNIVLFRKAKKLTQQALADVVNTTESYLGHVERGQRIPSLRMLCNIASALEVSPAELLNLSFDPHSLELRKLISTLSGKNIESIRFINEVTDAYLKSIETQQR